MCAHRLAPGLRERCSSVGELAGQDRAGSPCWLSVFSALPLPWPLTPPSHPDGRIVRFPVVDLIQRMCACARVCVCAFLSLRITRLGIV